MRRARIPAGWPFAEASQIVPAGGVNWHVQRFGAGPALLLIHGAGASTHSFRELAARLKDKFEIVMIDLPGLGFSSSLRAPDVAAVARALGALLREIGAAPAVIAGHSAGVAVALRLVLDGHAAPRAIVGFAPALKPYGGRADGIASKTARLALLNPLAARLLSAQASQTRVARLIERTGSRLSPEGLALYQQLLRQPGHIAGTLRLMAHWKLRPLQAELHNIALPVTFAAGEADSATPARAIEATARLIPDCRLISLPGLGHLAHEEDPARAADIILEAARAAGVTVQDTQTDTHPGLRLAGGASCPA
ncbi:alpha/beta fold hydrolase [Alkalicaulis satelles]|uniref:Alpha/beta fold hydrolase n=1 Tax=Alkalicaulis satelles TaxID=2609175 RepID=A0A5M6ZH42_9PROT|nr:alpha/beta fold hydrolase BchO [Alkalicaulis satelles]KAA5804049.1 alpha/beta fold hydrolase [Alkalicaulis satelles]